MDLHYRFANNSDLKSCEDLYQKTLILYDQKFPPNLPIIWTTIIENSAICGIPLIIDDHHRDPHHRIVAFAFSVFVNDLVLNELKDGHAIDHRTPLLSGILSTKLHLVRPTSVAQADASSGLNLVVISYARDESRGEDGIGPYIKECFLGAFLRTHAGYKIKEVLGECFHKDLAWVIRCGFLIRDRPRPYFTRSKCKCPYEAGPFIFGLTQDEAKESEGTMASSLFLYHPPRFRFKPHEQELLREAIEGRTDEEVCRTLNISLPTVKKRWSKIYGQVLEADGSVIPDTQQLNNDSKRGAEKRRRLLEYIRRHPEELIPLTRKSGTSSPLPPLRD